jgi:hypothetical protein
MSLKDELDRAGPVVDRVNAAIRDNPLAAGLIGAGVAWMLMGGAKGFGVMTSAVTGAAGVAGSAAATAGGALASGLTKAGSATVAGLKNAASTVTGAAADVAGSVASLVPNIEPDTDKTLEAVADTGAAVGNRINSVADAGREYGAAIQSRLSESLNKQPLLLGAIGLAIGAGLASTFASTAIESELMGEKGAAAREALLSLKADVTDRAKQIASEVQDEAGQQGLTADAVKRAAAGIGEKVKTVAGAGRDSLTQHLAPASR